jgi:hypothetical protein
MYMFYSCNITLKFLFTVPEAENIISFVNSGFAYNSLVNISKT